MKDYERDITELLNTCTFDFFGQSKHKLTPEKLLKTPDALILDVRSNEEFKSIVVSYGAFSNIDHIHIPISEITERIDEVPKDKNIAVFCPSNFRSTLVYAYLKMKGYESVRILSGGYLGLAELTMPGKLYKHLKEVNSQ